ncbi:MAG: AAA family ATPase, partial [Nitrospinota bacterium]
LRTYYRTTGGNRRYEKVMRKEIGRLREGLLYLLTTSDDLVTMLNRLLVPGSRYAIAGLKRAFFIPLLQALYPDRYSLWDRHIEAGIKRLGMQYWQAGESPGEIYQQLMRAKEALCSLNEHLDLFLLDDLLRRIGTGAFPLTEEPALYPEAPEEPVPVSRVAEEDIALQRLQQQVFLETETILEIEQLLQEKRQVIFYGPPGTGKTVVAEAFARYFTGSPRRVRLIQFHPSYTYEEFMEGIRPEVGAEGGIRYVVKAGIFKRWCEEARGKRERYLLIIDEINRGNLSRIFGELLYLLEYREKRVELPYSGEQFSVPSNLYLIGTMNTADRSIALVDHALRRRFHFIRFRPDSGVLRRWMAAQGYPAEWDPGVLDRLNERLRAEGVEENALLGHSYFMQPDLSREGLRRLLRYTIQPILEEYFFTEPSRAERIVRELWEEFA